MYSIDNRKSFVYLNNIFYNIYHVHNYDTFPIVLIGNKDDLKRTVSIDEGVQFAMNNHLIYFIESNKNCTYEYLTTFYKLLEFLKFGKLDPNTRYLFGNSYKKSNFNFNQISFDVAFYFV